MNISYIFDTIFILAKVKFLSRMYKQPNSMRIKEDIVSFDRKSKDENSLERK